MVCSACGYENQAGNRYCGMCGIPLPHRPLTTPGAQSTASLTRPLEENAGPVEPHTAMRRARSSGVASETTRSSDVARLPPDQDQDVERDAAVSQAAAPHLELVPEIPLHEYVQNFRYVPPSDPQESTMRGETSVLRPELVRPEALRPELVRPEPPAAAAAEDAPVAPVETATETTEAAPPFSTDDVRERLGLEVSSTPDERSDRPRFLDFNEAPKPIKPARAAKSISGPSFLGLNDPPPMEAASDEELEADELAPDGPWRGIGRMARIGLALVVVLGFGWLAMLEWKAQVGQTNNGSVEVVKMKMRDTASNAPFEMIKAKVRSLAHGVMGGNAGSQAAPDSTSKPGMQVAASKPRNQNSAAPASTPPATDGVSVSGTNAVAAPPASSAPAATVPPGNQPVAAPSAAAAAPNPGLNAGGTSAEQNAAPAAKTSAATTVADKSKSAGSPQPPAATAPTAGKPKPSPPAADDDEEVVVRKINPGAEELAKADNASDSAAEAAWLWKATAKGNPTAPVRLAAMYVKGEGVPRSCEQAIVLLKTAAEKENAVARNQLASMYGSGVCVPRDRVEAYRWASSALAANPSSDWAQQRRDQLWQQMTPQERALAEKYR